MRCYRQKLRRVFNSIVITLIVVILLRYFYEKLCKNHSKPSDSSPNHNWNYLMTGIPTRIFRYKDFCVLPNILASKMSMSWEYYKRITLVLHVDYSYLDDTLLYQVNTWDGPVSLAIVLSAINLKEAFFLTKEKVLRYAATTKEKLSVHLIYRWPVGCEKTNLEPDVPLPSFALYPANVARNVARMLSRSKYLLIADYAHIFSINFESQMLKLAEDVLERDPKTALVFRIFEANTNASSVPRDRQTLYEAYKKGEAIVFHGRYNPGAHTIPNLDSWFKRNITYDQPALSFTLPYNRISWEPQFVSLTTIPFHDEHFPYPIRDNTVLRWEMCRLEYKFVLVENVFMVHPGIKTPIDQNRRLKRIAAPIFQSALALFEKRMDKCCRETKKRCPQITLIPSARFLATRSPQKQNLINLAAHRRNDKILLKN